MAKIYKYIYSVLEAGDWIMVTPMVADISFLPISVTEAGSINILNITIYNTLLTLGLDSF